MRERERPLRETAPAIDDDVTFSELDREVRSRLRGLSKLNAEEVGKHLVMAGRLLATDPESAYAHAQAAVRRAGRIDVVREAAGITAYRTGRYAEALRELRTVRRLNGSSEHLPLMADCERGLGRPERALDLVSSPESKTLDPHARVELLIVASGARLDLGQPDAALAVLTGITSRDRATAARVAQARATALEALGRHEEARSELAGFTAAELVAAGAVADEEVVVFDLATQTEDESHAPDQDAGQEDAS